MQRLLPRVCSLCVVPVLLFVACTREAFASPLNYSVDRLTSSASEYRINEDIRLSLQSEKDTTMWKIVLDEDTPCEETFEPPPGVQLNNGTLPPQTSPTQAAPAPPDPHRGQAPRAMTLTIPRRYWKCPLSNTAKDAAGNHSLCFHNEKGKKMACVNILIRIPDEIKPDEAATFPRVYANLIRIFRVSDDLPRNPVGAGQAAVNILNETDYILKIRKVIPREAMADYNRRSDLVKTMAQSRAGTRFLLLYCTRHPETRDAQDMVIQSLRGFPDLQNDPSFAKFLNMLTHTHQSFDGEKLTDELELATLLEFRKTWLSWLQAVDPIGLSGSNENQSSADSLLMGACNALTRSWNPAGIEMVAALLNSAPIKARPMHTCLDYLAAMGDPRAAEIAARKTNVCQYPSSLTWADDRNLDRVLSSLSCERPVSLYTMGSRPDLMRGAAKIIFSAPSKASAMVATDSSWITPAYQQAGAVLSPEELLELVQSAEVQNDRYFTTYVVALGKKHSIVGNDELLRWAQKEKPDAISRAAGYALFLRLINPQRTSLLATIRQMAPEHKNELVFRILASSQQFPHLQFPQQFPMAIDDGVIGLEGEAYYNFTRPSPLPWNPDVLQRYESGLLEWIGWTKNPENLSTTYALMRSSEANRRFLQILKGGSETAIGDAWFYRKDVPETILSSLLADHSVLDSSRQYLLLLLSAKGNQDAYEEIRDLLKTEQSPAQDFFLPFLDEAVRWQDWRFLQDLFHQAESHPKDKESQYWKARTVEILAIFVREQPELARQMLGPLGSRLPDADVLVHALIKAESPNAESFLQRFQGTIQNMPGPKGQAQALWLAALQKTATPWCRQKILESGDANFLATIGDEGAAMLNVLQDRDEAAQKALRIGAISRALKIAHSDISSGRITTGTLNQDEFDSMEPELILVFPASDFGERIWLILHLGWDRITWTDEFISIAIKDTAGPVRLRALQYLLLHPTPKFRQIIRNMAASDPYPWCRRLAREILLFDPDPLFPDRGIRFDADF